MKVAAVIPAYNEEKTIGEIIKTVNEVTCVQEIIVVNDGSADNTTTVATVNGARVVELPDNLGKGGAMVAGVRSTEADIILFLDADLIGLRPYHVEALLAPVLVGRAQMTIGIFEEGRLATDLAQFIAPYLSGQRAVERKIFEGISGLDITRFGVEVALTRYARLEGISVEEVELKEMSHVMKEEKLGLIRGFAARLKMYWDIIKCLGIKKLVIRRRTTG